MNLLAKQEEKMIKNSQIPSEFYKMYSVKKGLRDVNGRGVLAGLTNISAIHSFDKEGNQIPGILEYRAYNIKDIVSDLRKENRFGFEEMTYLLLFGELPTASELEEFQTLLASRRTLPETFVRETILTNPSSDVINSMSRCLLALASYDEKSGDISIENVLKQSLDLIADFPLLAIYSYQSYIHYFKKESLYIHYPDAKLTTAENILRMLRPDCHYTDTEAKALDIALILHMEHGGGNNSTFTTHVVTSSGTDTYATIAAALSSLKGPKHGGANIKAAKMLENIKENISDFNNDVEIKKYLQRILNKEVFDQQGLIYGIGHAIYTVSDPRFEVFKTYVARLVKEKGLEKEFKLYEKIATLAPQVIAENRKTYKTISPNIDFYSGFVYEILGIPQELFTPLFAIARIVGWVAHRIEELINMNKIIRPAYESVLESKNYLKMEER
ncbi:citrate/2-methylcitrate synthase [Lactococcus kimchii]|uniref:citrate/2-methylcitrate synthase n=1 Tax=Lactococcus sp. S-13 TaxID=2507158 RepID=UPI0010232CF2|nr:citrate/2-methylcitrate synthase [Lactococcus sp. S-13]RZI48651.1 citrate/2-methylcitrate synthase [Lactococcus sp. S-13]